VGRLPMAPPAAGAATGHPHLAREAHAKREAAAVRGPHARALGPIRGSDSAAWGDGSHLRRPGLIQSVRVFVQRFPKGRIKVALEHATHVAFKARCRLIRWHRSGSVLQRSYAERSNRVP
jgi:hypothetical protein